ncbi:hypothetical protein IQ07DRAFT_66540 [Pyrenochaeta sp. DS3sAY3a]|nr:hypothetical protein IQ07DRAFT_66540 [Pyrenochaeta sp. DS3sAY3a]
MHASSCPSPDLLGCLPEAGLPLSRPLLLPCKACSGLQGEAVKLIKTSQRRRLRCTVTLHRQPAREPRAHPHCPLPPARPSARPRVPSHTHEIGTEMFHCTRLRWGHPARLEFGQASRFDMLPLLATNRLATPVWDPTSYAGASRRHSRSEPFPFDCSNTLGLATHK